MFHSLRSHSAALPSRAFRSACTSPDPAQQAPLAAHSHRRPRPRTANSSPLRGVAGARDSPSGLPLSQLGRCSTPSRQGPHAQQNESAGSFLQPQAVAWLEQPRPEAVMDSCAPGGPEQPEGSSLAEGSSSAAPRAQWQDLPASSLRTLEGQALQQDQHSSPGSSTVPAASSNAVSRSQPGPAELVQSNAASGQEHASELSSLAPSAWTEPRDWRDILGRPLPACQGLAVGIAEVRAGLVSLLRRSVA